MSRDTRFLCVGPGHCRAHHCRARQASAFRSAFPTPRRLRRTGPEWIARHTAGWATTGGGDLQLLRLGSSSRRCESRQPSAVGPSRRSCTSVASSAPVARVLVMQDRVRRRLPLRPGSSPDRAAPWFGNRRSRRPDKGIPRIQKQPNRIADESIVTIDSWAPYRYHSPES